jgi:hypothetical protein
MENIEDYGDLLDLPGSNPEDNIKLHPRADMVWGGGLYMPDHDGVIPKFV